MESLTLKPFGWRVVVQKQNRLMKREDFNKVYRFGKSIANRQFVLYFLPKREQEHFRLGISVSKKVGNAVVRNRLRRLVKEVVRSHGVGISNDYDFIFIVRKPAVGLEFSAVEQSVLHLLKKTTLIKKNVQKRSARQA